MIALRAAGSDGHRDFAVMRPGDFHDGVNRFHVRHQRQIGLLLFVRNGDVVERAPLFRGQDFEDVARRHAAERIKAFLREMQAVAFGDDLPRAPVQRHGVGQRAVAVENQSFRFIVFCLNRDLGLNLTSTLDVS